MSADAPKPVRTHEAADACEAPEPITGLARGGSTKAEALIGGRYRVQRVLGIGGMACVYLAVDSASARELAVKRLTVRARDRAYAEAAALFVREFHTLTALRHPCVVEVYDYGVDELGPFYTMDHVEGGDLKERAPCGWREACSLAYDVCSVLALLHSRRLVHGDISPRNVRCTRDGRAKLIDFGALSSMGPCDKIIGTPAFVAPEVVSRLTSDARTDLYSLGATLYYALTGKLPYPASDFASLAEVWLTPPPPPSHFNSSVPEALDAFVLSLLAQDPVERPSTAYEVMARLSALAGLHPSDEPELARAHLSTPALQGRAEPLERLHGLLSRMVDEAAQRGGVLIVGAPGEGRSRMLDEAVALAKTTGAVVLRVGATRGAVFGVVEQLLESFPELATKLFAVWPILAPLRAAVAARAALSAGLSTDEELRAFRPALLHALTEVMFQIAIQQPLVVAADDVQRLDHASLSLLIALVTGARSARRRLTVLATAEREELERAASELDRERPAHALLAAESEILQLTPLSAADTEQLLGSMFGDVPNLSLLSARVYKRAAGNPRATFDLLQYLMAHGRIVYARGGWTLPSTLHESDLPLTDAAAVQARLARLPRYGRLLLCAHALAPRAALRRDEYALMMETTEPDSERELDLALTELLTENWLRYDSRRFRAAHPGAASAALTAADGGEIQLVHRGLARFYARSPSSTMLVAQHLFAAGEALAALRTVLEWLADNETTEQLVAAAHDHPRVAAEVLAQALEAAAQAERPAREIILLEQWLLMLSPVVDSAYYSKVGPSLRAKLARDSGLAAYAGFLSSDEPVDALTRALMHASETYANASAAEQGLPPEQAIEWLARYVAVSIAIGSKTNDGALIASLPSLLEPFAQLSPLIEALWQNALAVCELSLCCKYMQARERWRAVLTRLPETSPADLQYVQYMRRAIVYAIGMLEIRLGIAQGAEWTEQLDADPSQAVNAMYLRKCLRLQAGDRDGAEQFRKQAELLHLHSTAEQMFTSNLMLELSAHAFARDVQGVKQTWDRIIPLAARYEGWIATELLARGVFHQLVGEPQHALDAFAASLRAIDFARDAGAKVVFTWPAASAGYIETLSELGRAVEAREFGEQALQLCNEREIDVAAHGIVRSLALAEAKSGETAGAIARLLALLDEQRALGVKGIQLAATYEARAKVALCMQDNASYREYARLGAAEYHEAHTSSLATRYSGWLTKTRDNGGFSTQTAFNTVQLRGTSSARARQRSDVVPRERDPQDHEE